MLDLLAGKKLEDLRIYAHKHPKFLALNSKAVVTELIQTYQRRHYFSRNRVRLLSHNKPTLQTQDRFR